MKSLLKVLAGMVGAIFPCFVFAMVTAGAGNSKGGLTWPELLFIWHWPILVGFVWLSIITVVLLSFAFGDYDKKPDNYDPMDRWG